MLTDLALTLPLRQSYLHSSQLSYFLSYAPPPLLSPALLLLPLLLPLSSNVWLFATFVSATVIPSMALRILNFWGGNGFVIPSAIISFVEM